VPQALQQLLLLQEEALPAEAGLGRDQAPEPEPLLRQGLPEARHPAHELRPS